MLARAAKKKNQKKALTYRERIGFMVQGYQKDPLGTFLLEQT
jgi:hypothetical protein